MLLFTEDKKANKHTHISGTKYDRWFFKLWCNSSRQPLAIYIEKSINAFRLWPRCPKKSENVNGVIRIRRYPINTNKHNPLTIIVPMRRLLDMSSEQKQQVDSKIRYDYLFLVSESVQVIAWVQRFRNWNGAFFRRISDFPSARAAKSTNSSFFFPEDLMPCVQFFNLSIHCHPPSLKTRYRPGSWKSGLWQDVRGATYCELREFVERVFKG